MKQRRVRFTSTAQKHVEREKAWWLRRVYLRRVGLHLYYTFNDDDVIVRALWAARREHGPEFKD